MNSLYCCLSSMSVTTDAACRKHKISIQLVWHMLHSYCTDAVFVTFTLLVTCQQNKITAVHYVHTVEAYSYCHMMMMMMMMSWS